MSLQAAHIKSVGRYGVIAVAAQGGGVLAIVEIDS